MRTQALLLITLSLLACFVAGEPSCSLLDNEKNLCFAASSLCTWTDDPAKDSCIDGCPFYPIVADDCRYIKGCAFTASTCDFKTSCPDQGKNTCTAANNCIYNTYSCSFNPAVTQVCSIEDACVDPLPAYCTKATTQYCVTNGATTNTCPQGVATQAECTAPCSSAKPVATCTSVCADLTQTDCLSASINCSWANNSCRLKDGLADCSTVISSCAANPQCVAGTAYNCSTTLSSLFTFCTVASPTTSCSAGQANWCSTITYDTCAVNFNYCVQGTDGNGCNTDTTNCITSGYCDTLDYRACKWSYDNLTCNPNICKGSFASCATSAPGGCQLNGSSCSPDDGSCLFIAGGTCTNIPSTPEQKDSQK